MRIYLARLLGRSHRVETAGDGATALAAALADPPDLVLADVMLPGDERPRGVDGAARRSGAGADDYLVTPFSARELRARVAGRVALGRARREAARRFHAIADSTPALIWADGPGGRRVFAAVGDTLLGALATAGLVVDLRGTGYVSSAGVALLVELATRGGAEGAALTLRVSAGSPVARVLELTGLRTVLPVVAG